MSINKLDYKKYGPWRDQFGGYYFFNVGEMTIAWTKVHKGPVYIH